MVPRFPVALALFAVVNFALLFSPGLSSTVLARPDLTLTAKVLKEGMPASWWLARTYLGDAKPDIVVCGSSQIGGLQAADANTSGKTIDLVYNRRCLTIENDLKAHFGAVNVFLSALPGAMVSDHFAIARALYKDGRKPAILVLTVSPRDFIDNTLPAAGATDSYRFFSQYADLSKYVHLAFHDPWSRFTYFVSSELPVRKFVPGALKLAEDLTTAVAPKAKPGSDNSTVATTSGVAGFDDNTVSAAEQIKFVMGGYGGNLKPGQATLAPNLPKIYVDNTNDYKHRYAKSHPDSYDVQFTYMRDFLAQLKQDGTQVLVVGMPLTQVNRDLLSAGFWQGFRSRLSDVCKQQNATYIDLSAASDFSSADFCDTVHLNADGGTRLAQHISNTIWQTQALRDALQPALKH